MDIKCLHHSTKIFVKRRFRDKAKHNFINWSCFISSKGHDNTIFSIKLSSVVLSYLILCKNNIEMFTNNKMHCSNELFLQLFNFFQNLTMLHSDWLVRLSKHQQTQKENTESRKREREEKLKNKRPWEKKKESTNFEEHLLFHFPVYPISKAG